MKRKFLEFTQSATACERGMGPWPNYPKHLLTVRSTQKASEKHRKNCTRNLHAHRKEIKKKQHWKQDRKISIFFFWCGAQKNHFKFQYRKWSFFNNRKKDHHKQQMAYTEKNQLGPWTDFKTLHFVISPITQTKKIKTLKLRAFACCHKWCVTIFREIRPINGAFEWNSRSCHLSKSCRCNFASLFLGKKIQRHLNQMSAEMWQHA